MKVWVSGARGKLGREVCRLLEVEGRPHVAADRVPDAAGRSVDLLDPGAVATSLRDCDAIIHCAGVPSPENIEPVEPVRINTLTTFNALEEAWRAGLRTAEVRGVAASMPEADQVRNLFGYVGLEDAARACLLSLEPRSGTGPYEVLVIAADDATSEIPTEQLLARFCPQADVRRPIPGRSGAFDISRAKAVIGWEPRTDRG